MPRSINPMLVLIAAATPAIQLAANSPLAAHSNGAAQNRVAAVERPDADDIDEAETHIHGFAAAKAPNRFEAVNAFAAEPAGKAAIEGLLQGKHVGVQELALGTHRHDGKKFEPEAIAGANWNTGFLVDGMNPDIYTRKGEVALRLRTNSVVIHPAYSIRQMAETAVMRLKGTRFEQLFRVTINVPEAKTGDADPYLISIGMLSGWKGDAQPPVAIFMDGKPMEYTFSTQGLQLVKRMQEGNHRMTVHVTPEFEGDIFEFRYVMVNRL